MTSQGPLIVQSDHTLMLEVEHLQYTECRDFLALFAELVKSPEFIHTYKVTPLSLWNAAALEIPLQEIIVGLERFSRYRVPANVIFNIREWYGVYGKLVLQHAAAGRLRLAVADRNILERIRHDSSLQQVWLASDAGGMFIAAGERGNLKHALIKAGYPVKDLCGYLPGERFDISLRSTDLDGNPFALRDYQKDAAEAFYHAGRATGGSGVIVLPCGAGKTIVGMGTMEQIRSHTLIITTNNVAVHQWRDELLSKTDVTTTDIGEFTGLAKEIRPITITTYQMLTYRRSRAEPLRNLDIFTTHDWGLIIYDEVHLLPAPVFRATTAIQAKRRLGLTATLVREDGKEDDVFALIGPKRYDVPWKTLESRGYIAEAICTEYRIPLPPKEELRYARADKRAQFRIAAENPRKTALVEELIFNHRDESILVIGQFISQVEGLARSLGLPIITGKTKHEERERLYADFRKGIIKVLVVSKVANFAVDLAQGIQTPSELIGPCWVLEVEDGDSIHVRLPDGSPLRIRYLGVSAAEPDDQKRLGPDAKRRNKALLEDGWVWLETERVDGGFQTDRDGRVLADVFLHDHHVHLIQERLVSEGLALLDLRKVIDRDLQTASFLIRYVDRIIAAQIEAARAQRGL